MALSAEEEALLASLEAKKSEPAPEKKYTSVESILEYLVRTSDKFSANPEDREEMLAFLDSALNPSSGDTNAEAN